MDEHAYSLEEDGGSPQPVYSERTRFHLELLPIHDSCERCFSNRSRDRDGEAAFTQRELRRLLGKRPTLHEAIVDLYGLTLGQVGEYISRYFLGVDGKNLSMGQRFLVENYLDSCVLCHRGSPAVSESIRFNIG